MIQAMRFLQQIPSNSIDSKEVDGDVNLVNYHEQGGEGIFLGGFRKI